jgi:hypothetical protein
MLAKGPIFDASMFGLKIHLELVHLGEVLGIVARFFKIRDDQLHCFYRGERIEHLAEYPDPLQIFFWDEQLFFTGSGTLDVDSREDALVDKLPVENDFHVAGALELFEDDFVHAGAGIDEGGGDDGERAAFFNVAG